MIRQCLGYTRHMSREVIVHTCTNEFDTGKTRRVRCPECSYYHHLEISNRNPKKNYYRKNRGKGRGGRTYDTSRKVKYKPLKMPIYNKHTLMILPVGGKFESAVAEILAGRTILV